VAEVQCSDAVTNETFSVKSCQSQVSHATIYQKCVGPCEKDSGIVSKTLESDTLQIILALGIGCLLLVALAKCCFSGGESGRGFGRAPPDYSPNVSVEMTSLSGSNRRPETTEIEEVITFQASDASPVGMDVDLKLRPPKVNQVFLDLPAYLRGVKGGDLIVSVNDVRTSEMDDESIIAAFQARPFSITVRRQYEADSAGSSSRRKRFTVRDQIYHNPLNEE